MLFHAPLILDLVIPFHHQTFYSLLYIDFGAEAFFETIPPTCNFEEYQSYSQNMGHEDPGTTFKYYSKLSHNDIREIILKNIYQKI
jgi:hypothetical protein